MKKFLPIILCLVLVCGLFAACANNGTEDETTTTTEEVTSSTGITTDEAKIAEGDAIRLMESYSNKELGLSKSERDDVTFLVANNGEEIDGKYYIKVIAAVKQEHVDKETGKKTYTFDEKGAYFINYNGEEILSLDSETGEYSQMEVKEVPTTKAPTTHSQEEIEKSKED